MSNFMSDAVLSEKISSDVWKTIVKRFIIECAVIGDMERSKVNIKEMVSNEVRDAATELHARPKFSGQSDAEHERDE